MKKRIASLCLLLGLLLGTLSLLQACGAGGRPASLGESIAIPEDGVIAASVFEELKRENKVVHFQGESGGLSYEWTVFGREIDSPRPCNLGVAVEEVGPDRLVFRFLSTEEFGFSPMLSFTLPGEWRGEGGDLYRPDGEGDTPVGHARLTKGERWTLHITPPSQTGVFVLRAGGSDADSSGDASSAETRHTCRLSIECSTIFDNLEVLDQNKLDVLPKDGVLLPLREVEFEEGESVYDLLRRVCEEEQILLETSFTPLYGSVYVEGIGNLYEFDCGPGSGWMYRVDGWYPNYGCSQYRLQEGSRVEWRYTCDLGKDIGGEDALVGENEKGKGD